MVKKFDHEIITVCFGTNYLKNKNNYSSKLEKNIFKIISIKI